MINIGDSATIDTNRVIYIENQNYHSYIFRIERNKVVAGDPIDNLMLTPNGDGTYKEYLIQYYLSEQELQKVNQGTLTIPTNRINMFELLPGTYNNGQLVQELSQNCVWTTVFLGYTTCSENVHSNGEGPSQCSAGTRSQPVYGSYWRCESIDDTPFPGNPSLPGGDEGGNGGGGGSTGPPCNSCPPPSPCIEIPTDPTQPSTGIGDDGGCIIGIPIIPNLPNPKSTPCDKIKKVGKNSVTKNAMKHLKTGMMLKQVLMNGFTTRPYVMISLLRVTKMVWSTFWSCRV